MHLFGTCLYSNHLYGWKYLMIVGVHIISSWRPYEHLKVKDLGIKVILWLLEPMWVHSGSNLGYLGEPVQHFFERGPKRDSDRDWIILHTYNSRVKYNYYTYFLTWDIIFQKKLHLWRRFLLTSHNDPKIYVKFWWFQFKITSSSGTSYTFVCSYKFLCGVSLV